MKKKVLAVLLGVSMMAMGQVPVFAEADDADAVYGSEQFEGLKAEGDYHFKVVVKSFLATYWQAAMQGVEQAAKDLNVTYDAQGPNTESDIADQVNMLNSAVNSEPDGIALSPLDSAACHEALANASEAGIPVVTFDSDVAEDEAQFRDAAMVTEGRDAGAIAADHMYDALKERIESSEGQVRIGLIAQDATSVNITTRGLGFIDKLIEKASADGKTCAVVGNEYFVNNASDKGDESSADIIIEASVPAQPTVDNCATEANTLLSKNDLIGIFGSNQPATEGILSINDNLEVLGTDPSSDVIGIAFDAGTITKAAVQDGILYGGVTQSPYRMGYYAICALVAKANGQEVHGFDPGASWYDVTNMDDPEIAPDLYD